LVLSALLAVSILFAGSFSVGAEVADEAAAIDTLVDATLSAEGVAPNPEISDATFLRRAYLDIAGRIPTPEEADAFYESGQNRPELIAKLIRSDAFVSHSYNWWADVLRLKGNAYQEAAYQLWVKDALRENLPYDQMVRDLVAPKGLIWENGAAGYYFRDIGMPLDNMSNTVRIFLGTRLECAQCHNHPFDKWTQMDYFQMAAFTFGVNPRDYAAENRNMFMKSFAERRDAIFKEASGQDLLSYPRKKQLQNLGKIKKRLDREGIDPEEFKKGIQRGIAAVEKADLESEAKGAREAFNDLYNNLQYVRLGYDEKRSLKLPHDYQYDDAKPKSSVVARAMFALEEDGASREIGTGLDAYAEWMTSPANPAFTKVIVNRLWKRAFGVGVYEPVDDLTEHTLPSDPALLGHLEELLRDLNYDTRAFLEVIYNTRAYQRAANTEEVLAGVPYYFPGPKLRRLTAEQIWDSLVGLCIQEADSFHPNQVRLERSIAVVKARYEALEGVPYEEFAERASAAAKVSAEDQGELNELRESMLAALDAGDSTRVTELRKEYRAKDGAAERKLNEIFEIGGRRAAMAAGAGSAMKGYGVRTKDRKNLQIDLPDPPEGLSKSQMKAWKSGLNRDMSMFKRLVGEMARASELQAPARRGHFLREFGQSDREEIQNANHDASVPQALNLLNGRTIDAIANRFAVFGRRIEAADTERAKIEAIFAAMLTRRPTEAEFATISDRLDFEDPKAYRELIWALLNTQQFMFIQ